MSVHGFLGNNWRRTSSGAQSVMGSCANTDCTRSGRRNATVSAVAPPKECPITWRRSVFRQSTKEIPNSSNSGIFCVFNEINASAAPINSLERNSVCSRRSSVYSKCFPLFHSSCTGLESRRTMLPSFLITTGLVPSVWSTAMTTYPFAAMERVM
jgi:hypothetical protein